MGTCPLNLFHCEHRGTEIIKILEITQHNIFTMINFVDGFCYLLTESVIAEETG